MEVVNTLDIDSTQWELQDREARNGILELKNKDEEIIASINDIKNTHFPNNVGVISNFSNDKRWYKLNNFYSGDPYNDNVFLLTARRGEMIELICPIEDNSQSYKPIAIRHVYALARIEQIKFKNGNIYILSGLYNTIRINQIAGTKCEPQITTEDPPSDAEDISIDSMAFV